jgi:ketosteroid isomerase-like protein
MTSGMDTLAPRTSADLTAELLLRFHREPTRFSGEARRRDAPPVANEVILKLALGRRIEFADPALNEAGTVAVLKEAAALYVRHVFFRPDATPYQILGLAPGAPAPAIKESFRLLMQLVHPDRQDSSDAWPESFAALANRAYGMLRDQDARAAYDHDAAARARVAREVYRKAAAAEASMMPVPVWPAGRLGGRRPLGRSMLPEWLTAGVGGYVRAHPAVAAFVVLTVGAALVIGMSVRAGPEELLMREVREVLAPAAPEVPEMARAVAEPTVPVAGVAAMASGSRSVGVERPGGPAAAVVPPGRASGAPEDPRGPSGNGAVEVAAAPPSSISIAAGSTAGMVAATRREPVVAPSTPVVAEASAPALPAAAPALTPAAPSSPSAAPATPAAAPALLLAAPATPSATPASAPASPEIEALFAEFVEAYERGRLDAFTALFDADADTNLRHGRAAIRNEYDELFRLSNWRRMQLTRINWRRAGDRAYAKGEIAIRIGWRDGREVEERVAVDMELVRRDGRVVIARLSHQPKNP